VSSEAEKEEEEEEEERKTRWEKKGRKDDASRWGMEEGWKRGRGREGERERERTETAMYVCLCERGSAYVLCGMKRREEEKRRGREKEEKRRSIYGGAFFNGSLSLFPTTEHREIITWRRQRVSVWSLFYALGVGQNHVMIVRVSPFLCPQARDPFFPFFPSWLSDGC
jgi:hypothetical protein